MIIFYNFCHSFSFFYIHHHYIFIIRLRIRITICLFKQMDKTSILSERYYNLFYVTHVGIIYFDTIKKLIIYPGFSHENLK